MTGLRNALVIGGTGFIGSTLVRRLAGAGIPTYCLLFQDRARRPIPGGHRIESASSSAADIEHSLSGMRFDVVFHLAACGVSPDQRDPDALLDGNVGLLTRVLQALSGSPPRLFVNTGSSAEYRCDGTRRLLSEDDPTLPISLYGAAKAASVAYGNALARQLGIPIVTLRLFHVFGEGEADHRLVRSLMRSLTSETGVDLTPGEQVRDLLYIDDVADAFLAAGRGILAPYTVYNVCSGQPVSVREIAESVARVLGKSQQLLLFGRRQYRSDEEMWVVGDNRRFVQATGWRPKVSLTQGIAKMMEGLQ